MTKLVLPLLVQGGKNLLEGQVLEAASRGCAVIISNRGGLPETITNGIILRNLNSNSLFLEIEKLIKNKSKLYYLQKESLKNFYLTDNYISKKLINIAMI